MSAPGGTAASAVAAGKALGEAGSHLSALGETFLLLDTTLVRHSERLAACAKDGAATATTLAGLSAATAELRVLVAGLSARLTAVEFRSAAAYNSGAGDGSGRPYVAVPLATTGALPGDKLPPVPSAQAFNALTSDEVAQLCSFYEIACPPAERRRRLKDALGITSASARTTLGGPSSSTGGHGPSFGAARPMSAGSPERLITMSPPRS